MVCAPASFISAGRVFEKKYSVVHEPGGWVNCTDMVVSPGSFSIKI